MVKKTSTRHLLKNIFLAFMLYFMLTNNVTAKSQAQLYSTISLDMYVLDGAGAKIVPHQLCNTNTTTRQSFGCTAYPGDPNHEYPFSSNNITINIESDIRSINGENIELGYLYNVTPHELDIAAASQGNKPLSSVMAQAIASRTFAYYHIDLGSTIDNAANGFQVYIPYRYHQFTGDQKLRVNEALAEIFYMTADGSTTPIRAHFGADNDDSTQDGGTSYLKSVYDPISADFGQDIGTPNGGMSSRGASRWGFGHTSSRGPVASGDPQYPHDDQGNGDPWSVKWNESFQILTHYYTDIHVRDENGNIVTPENRWNPLQIYWPDTGGALPPVLTPGNSYQVWIMPQNTGVTSWVFPDHRLAYQWANSQGTIVSEDLIGYLVTPPGGPTSPPFIVENIQIPTTPGMYTLIFDMQIQVGGNYENFRDREANRPWYPLEYNCEVGGSGQCTMSGGSAGGEGDIYLPIIMKNAS